jgi:hypothetical protein
LFEERLLCESLASALSGLLFIPMKANRALNPQEDQLKSRGRNETVATVPTSVSGNALRRADWRHPHLLFGIWGAILATLAGSLILGWQPVLWLQPSIVGVMWGGVFTFGLLLGGPGQGRLLLGVVTCLGCLVITLAFRNLTNFDTSDSLLFSSALALGGWATAKCCLPSTVPIKPGLPPATLIDEVEDHHGILGQSLARLHDHLASDQWRGEGQSHADRQGDQTRRSRWSIWDLGLLTLVAALWCHSVPAISAHPLLLLGVASAMVGGLMCSVAAYRWAVRDRWSWWQLVGLGCNLILAVAVVFYFSPDGMRPWAALAWMLGGPVNVVASQGVTVLLGSTLLRASSLVNCLTPGFPTGYTKG